MDRAAAEATCIKCKQPINYNPFLCDLCGGSLCLTCIGDDGIGFCDDCTDIQMVSLEEAKPKPKCIYCDRDAIIVDVCQDNTQKQKQPHNQTKPQNGTIKMPSCFRQIRVCKDHIVKCEVCKKILCDQCAVNKLCYGHMRYCGSCCGYFTLNKMLKCLTCGKGSCSTCAWKQGASLIPGDINADAVDERGYKVNSMICSQHIKMCWCKFTLRETPMYRCTYPNCKRYACESGHFRSLIKKKIYACHKHRSTCNICYKEYPALNRKIIKFRGQTPIGCCSNCYGQFYDGVVGLLQVCRRLVNLPRDVKNLILHIYVELLQNA